MEVLFKLNLDKELELQKEKVDYVLNHIFNKYICAINNEQTQHQIQSDVDRFNNEINNGKSIDDYVTEFESKELLNKLKELDL